MNYPNIGAALRTQKGFAWVFGAVFIGAVIALGVFANTTAAQDASSTEPIVEEVQQVPLPTEDTAELCADAVDNDGDGATDLDDSDCASFIPAPADTDEDGVADDADNCPAVANPDQADADDDGDGDACDAPDELRLQTAVLVVSDLNLTSVCSDDPTQIRRWRIYNPNSFDVNVTWEVVGTGQTAVITAKAAGTGEPKWPGDLSGNDYTFFETATVGGANTTKIKWQNENQQWKEKVKASGGEECPKPQTVDVVAQKIECDDESDLPNWGEGYDEDNTVFGGDGLVTIGATTAQDWLDKVGYDLGCDLVDWDFEWSFRSVAGDPDDNAGLLGGDWTAFTDGVAVIDVSNAQDLGLREALEEGYIPFTGQNTDQDASAEFYCGTDVLHYDNWEWIDAVAGETYYCVAWNVSAREENLCRVEVVSDDTNKVVETGAFAVPTWDEHTAWTANIPFATWIWKSFLVENPTQDETYTFKKTFAVEDVNDALLSVAADNSYEVFINGNPVTADAAENNFQVGTQDNNIDVASFLTENALNSIEVRVKNRAQGGGTAQSNPAGALYRLVVNEESEELCEQPPQDETTDVTICKYDERENELSGWTVMLLGDFVENVNVPSNGTEVFSSALTNGDPYAFIANGTYVYRPGAEGDISDPAFTKRSYSGDPIDPTGEPYEPWYDVNDLPGFPGYLGIAIDNDPAGTNWSDIYNSLHTYALGYTGTGAPAGFKIFDDVYGDNSGSLNVAIYEGYVGTTGENGCVTFEDVPFGDYTLDEILQDGWTNVSGKDTEVIVGEKENNFTLVNTQGDGCLIDGYKYDEEDNPLGGWTIGLEQYPNYTLTARLLTVVDEDGITLPEGHTLIGTDETDKDGYYCIQGELPEEGDWNFRGFEVLDHEGWAPVEYVFDDGDPAPLNVDEELDLAFTGLFNQNWPDHIDFYNEEDGGGQDLTCDPEVNLVKNGSFESPNAWNGGTGWQLFANFTPGLEWVAKFVSDDTDAPLEIQAGYSGWTAEDGSQYAELDSTASTIISQDVPTIPGNKYRLSYWRAARPGTSPAEDNAVEAFVDGNSVDTSVFNIVEGNPYWYPSPTIEFTATGATTNIALKDIGPEQGGSSNSYGIFVDNVELYCVPKEEEHHNEVTICKYEVNDEQGENNPGMPGWTVGLNAYEPEPEIELVKTINPREYEGVTGGDGCVTFHDVDLDQYLVEEDMQEGWKYFSGAGNGQVWNIDSDQAKYTFNLINQRTGEGDDDDQSSLTIDKVVAGENANANQKFDFDLSWLDQDVDLTLSANDAPETFSDLSADDYDITEILGQGDWYLTDVNCDAEYSYNSENHTVTVYVGADEDVTCTFTNTYRPGDDGENDGGDDSSTSGGGGTSFRRSGGSSNGGQVLGASTDNPFCPFLRDYQHISFNNDPYEVNKAKAFFNSYMGKSLELNGIFDQAMFDAVVEFQSMFKSDVLDTWVEHFGFLDDEPTGYLYQTTKWKINSIMCPGYEAFPDQLILDSHGNSVASAQ